LQDPSTRSTDRQAACRYKEAIKECNQGLAVEGSNAKVLYRRARARFEMELYKDALNDITKVNASAEKSEDSTAFETKVRAALTGNKPAGGEAPAGSVASKPSQKPQYTKEHTAQMLRQANNSFVCKVTLDSETKVLHLPYGISYYALQHAIKEKWTGLHNFKIFYHDRESDWVLVTCAKDVAKAQQEILAYAQRLVTHRQRQGLDSQVQFPAYVSSPRPTQRHAEGSAGNSICERLLC
jgi:tetratricopeptide (TPR) repeat protein